MSWKESVIKSLSDKFDQPTELLFIDPVGGGSINDTYRLSTTGGDFFIKKNSASTFPEMFQKEVRGLEILGNAEELKVPEVVDCFEEGDDALLVMKFIRSAAKKENFWEEFARLLAQLHRNTQPQFGLDHDNYIGSLVQTNTTHDTWSDFFREERLEPQIRSARDTGYLNRSLVNAFDRFYNRLQQLFPGEPPALLHGDLWGGNFMTDESGDPVIIDPAVYYGHREMDLGMSMLFGGFDRKFYDAYDRYFPLEPGWQERMDYCNLYPLLVHVNLFGGGYVRQVEQIIRRF